MHYGLLSLRLSWGCHFLNPCSHRPGKGLATLISQTLPLNPSCVTHNHPNHNKVPINFPLLIVGVCLDDGRFKPPHLVESDGTGAGWGCTPVARWVISVPQGDLQDGNKEPQHHESLSTNLNIKPLFQQKHPASVCLEEPSERHPGGVWCERCYIGISLLGL